MKKILITALFLLITFIGEICFAAAGRELSGWVAAILDDFPLKQS